MAERTFVIGVGMTDFVKPSARPDWDYPDMVREAGTQALEDAGVSYRDVQHVAAGYCFGDTTAGQRAVYELGHTGVPVVNVNNACATGSTALMVARNAVAAGMADCALAIGFENMARYGTRAESFARIAVKNHKHSVHNPRAQFRKEFSLEEVMASPAMFPPL